MHGRGIGLSYGPRRSAIVVVLLAWLAIGGFAPSAKSARLETLLPAETLVFVSVTNLPSAIPLLAEFPETGFWRDPAVAAFREQYLRRLGEELVRGLEGELRVNVTNVVQTLGPTTVAMVDSRGILGEHALELLMVADSEGRSEKLKGLLAAMKAAWGYTNGSPAASTTGGASGGMRVERIGSVEFTVLRISTNQTPAYLKLGPEPLGVAPGGGGGTNGGAMAVDLFVGQAGSLLVAATSGKIARKVVERIDQAKPGGAGVTLCGTNETAFAFAKEAPVYGWMNTEPMIGLLTLSATNLPMIPRAGEEAWESRPLVRATGLNGVSSVKMALKPSAEGAWLETSLGLATPRQGLLKLLPSEGKDTLVPAFIPASAKRFQRWRLDAYQGWLSAEAILAEVSPQSASAVGFILSTANDAARLKEPGFDIRARVFGNLGDDFIWYEAGGTNVTGPESKSVFLISSPKSEELAGSLARLLIFLTPKAETPVEREVAGAKVRSVELAMLWDGAAGGVVPSLHYAVVEGYVALSLNESALEELLRTRGTPGKGWREMPGVAEAGQRAAGTNAIGLAMQDRAEKARQAFSALGSRGNAGGGADTAGVLLGLAGLLPWSNGLGAKMTRHMDAKLLPPFEKVERHFGVSAQSVTLTPEGLMVRAFYPGKK